MKVVSPKLRELCKSWFRTGSSFTCNPPVLNTDVDWVVLTDSIHVFNEAALNDGWEGITTTESSIYGLATNEFNSYRKGVNNLIVVTNLDSFNLRHVATTLAKRFNLLNKVDRIDLFHAILFGKLPSEDLLG